MVHILCGVYPVVGLYQDHPLGFMLQCNIAEGNVTLSKFWQQCLETKDIFIQTDQGLFIKAGENLVNILVLLCMPVELYCACLAGLPIHTPGEDIL